MLLLKNMQYYHNWTISTIQYTHTYRVTIAIQNREYIEMSVEEMIPHSIDTEEVQTVKESIKS